MKIEQMETPGLAAFSYVIFSGKDAAVIDPRRDTAIYHKSAAHHGAKIRYVLETHIHADYASGARQLAKETGALLCLSGHDEGEEYSYQFPHQKLRDGDQLLLGKLRLEVLHTPGHTPEHLCFVLYDPTSCGQPLALFSGDLLFAGSVGRPDLLGQARTYTLARELVHTLKERIARLPDGMLLYPAHGAGSLCGADLAERTVSTLGYERSCNPFLTQATEEEAVRHILATLPEFPEYYRRMKKLNSEGPPILDGIPGARALSLEEFVSLQEEDNTVIVDLRTPEAFGGAHIPGSLSIGFSPAFSLWAGWILPYEANILLVGEPGSDLTEARSALVRVGHDRIVGYLEGGIRTWISSGRQVAHVPQASVEELADRLPNFNKEGIEILDVRSPTEWCNGHLPHARHIPCGQLPKRLHELSPDISYWVVCGSGYRSSIATSLLKRAGFVCVTNVDGGMEAWKTRNYPVIREEKTQN
ncbi:MBL fold metallo-hydrolase [Candidatus Methylacidithermus pantelleriae]|uniref:Rhodanese domain protein n=1 Tax=Candidatus Methylacidithermus pantelleriae TaxID=2744239 RepID=A0A8J2FPH9_9BACT|nr:MBL fold metallo-hydrolase [Candidatus Methylacidithermus pantelleriae]CAF0702686.1 Rhodanese domain protein [Candidatus Methylacidithermus pantelleriae]